MTKLICDVCGEEIPRMDAFSIIIKAPETWKDIDLCPTCFRKGEYDNLLAL